MYDADIGRGRFGRSNAIAIVQLMLKTNKRTNKILFDPLVFFCKCCMHQAPAPINIFRIRSTPANGFRVELPMRVFLLI